MINFIPKNNEVHNIYKNIAGVPFPAGITSGSEPTPGPGPEPGPTPDPYVNQYFTITNEVNALNTVYMYCNNYSAYTFVDYSLDNGNTWQTKQITDSEDTESRTLVTLDANQSVILRHTGALSANPFSDYNVNLYCSAEHSFSGNVASLTQGDDFVGSFQAPFGAFNRLFQNDYNLISIANLRFDSFTTLSGSCFTFMFMDCSRITESPMLPATTIVDNCYNGMFMNCSMLSTLKVGALEWNTMGTTYWACNVAPNGTFYKPAGTEIESGMNGIPDGWTVVNI